MMCFDFWFNYLLIQKKKKTFAQMNVLLSGMGIDNAIHLDSVQNGAYQYKGKKETFLYLIA